MALIKISSSSVTRTKHLFNHDNISLFATDNSMAEKAEVGSSDSFGVRVHLNIFWLVADDDTATYNIERHKRATCTISGNHKFVLEVIEFVPIFLLEKSSSLTDVIGKAFRIHITKIRLFARKAFLSLCRRDSSAIGDNGAAGGGGGDLELCFHVKVYPEGRYGDVDGCEGWRIWGRYREVPDKYEQKECAICLNEFGEDAEVSVMACFHVFHAVCLARSLKFSGRCPICRLPSHT